MLNGEILDENILVGEIQREVINTGITEEVDPTVPEYVKAIREQDIANWNKVNNLGNVFRYKGSVQIYAELPAENNEVGDVWNVEEAHEEYGAGTNFAWSDKGEWDALGGIGGGGVSEEEFNKLVNNETQIVGKTGIFYNFLAGGTRPTTKSGIAIGKDASLQGSDNVVIGKEASGYNWQGTNGMCVALGSNASCSAFKTYQLGQGSNKTPNTFQVANDNIYNHKTHTLTVQNIELNGVDLGTQLGDLNTALETILGV